MEPNFLTDIVNLLLFPLYVVEVIWQILAVAAQAIGFVP